MQQHGRLAQRDLSSQITAAAGVSLAVDNQQSLTSRIFDTHNPIEALFIVEQLFIVQPIEHRLARRIPN